VRTLSTTDSSPVKSTFNLLLTQSKAIDQESDFTFDDDEKVEEQDEVTMRPLDLDMWPQSPAEEL
jgi:hypothetical protein